MKSDERTRVRCLYNYENQLKEDISLVLNSTTLADFEMWAGTLERSGEVLAREGFRLVYIEEFHENLENFIF